MTPKQEARLLRARAVTLLAHADEGHDVPVYEMRAEAAELEAVAAELEAQAEREVKVRADAACAACGHAFRDHLPHAPGQFGSCIAGVFRKGSEGQRCGCPVFVPVEVKP